MPVLRATNVPKMLFLGLLLRAGLSAIFAIAGTAKLVDQHGTRHAVANFGMPRPLVPAAAVLLPVVELLIAAGLLFGDTVWPSAWAALGLLTLFLLTIAVSLAQGRTHDCHCFGQLHSRPLGWPTLLKNIAFALAAGAALWLLAVEPQLGTGVIESFSQLSPSQTNVFIAIALLSSCLLVHAQTQKPSGGETAPLVKSLPIDSPAPSFQLTDYDGGSRSLKQLLSDGKPLMLLFTNPKCGPCVSLFREISDWQTIHGAHLNITLISRGSIKDNFVSVARNGLGQVLLQQDREVAEKYGAHVTPSAVLLTSDGRIASSVAAGADQIRGLLESTVNEDSIQKSHEILGRVD